MINELFNRDHQHLENQGFAVHISNKSGAIPLAGQSVLMENMSILLIGAGILKISISRTVLDLLPRDLLIIPKDTFCTILEVKGRPQLYIITFSAEFAIKNCLRKELVEAFYFFIRQEPLKNSLSENEFSLVSLIYKLIYMIVTDAEGKESDDELRRLALSLFLQELKLVYVKNTQGKAVHFSRKESFVLQFLTVLSIHFKKQHSVRFYAGVLCVTSGHLNKMVSQVTGRNAKVFIREALIAEARVLLGDPHLTIAQIAEELDFSSASVFSIFFKRHTALSPREYRSKAM